jgi:hypothetical protein
MNQHTAHTDIEYSPGERSPGDLSQNGHGGNQTQLAATVLNAVQQVPIYDIQHHLYDPLLAICCFTASTIAGLSLPGFGVVSLLEISYDAFWSMSKDRAGRSDLGRPVRAPFAGFEACRGVLTLLNKLGLDVNKRDLARVAPVVFEVEQRRLHRALHGAGERAHYLHDQLALR